MPDIVLIADDDQAVLTMLYKVVRSNGIEADTAASGEEALALLEQCSFRRFAVYQRHQPVFHTL